MSIDRHEITPRQWMERPYLSAAPQVYEPDSRLLERIHRGDSVSEREAYASYFDRLQHKDPEYFRFITSLAEIRSKRFPDTLEQRQNRTMHIIVPAYREGENIASFLSAIQRQFETSGRDDWGVTIVMDYSIPYRQREEFTALRQMVDPIEAFIQSNPQYRHRIDWIYYARSKDMPVLPVGLARKVGEDVALLERLRYLSSNSLRDANRPFYLGLMDVDTTNLDDGIIGEMVEKATTDTSTPAIIRARGSYKREEIRSYPILHPLEVVWEGTTSQIAKRTTYNPFTVGRLSAVPAKEYIITGGGFARRLNFPDEDIRHGIQIAWQIPHVRVVETERTYATTARRELGTLQGILYLTRSRALEKVIEESQKEQKAPWFGEIFSEQTILLEMLKKKEDIERVCRGEENISEESIERLLRILDRVPLDFDRELMECGALLRMYGNWANQTFRRSMGNVQISEQNDRRLMFSDQEDFSSRVPPKVIEVLVNGAYRFAVFAMIALDKLSKRDDVPEVIELKKQFLLGNMAHFSLEIEIMNILKRIHDTDPERFEQLKPAIHDVDQEARSAIQDMLDAYGIAYIVAPEPVYGLLEEEGDRTMITAPFKILPSQERYRGTLEAILRQE